VGRVRHRRTDGRPRRVPHRHGGPHHRVRVDPAALGANLDATVGLFDGAGNLIASADPNATDRGELGAELTATVARGTYYVVVGSHGGYGDVGQYTVSVEHVRLEPGGLLTVDGEFGAGAGSVTIDRAGDDLLVRVAPPGGPVIVRRFPLSSVSSIRVRTGAGPDTISTWGAGCRSPSRPGPATTSSSSAARPSRWTAS
jgi:hypothetical protein